MLCIVLARGRGGEVREGVPAKCGERGEARHVQTVYVGLGKQVVRES